jgi:hypothetical protein
MLFALAGLTALFLRLYEESLIVIGYATVVLAGGFNLEWYLILPMPFLILCVVAVFDRVFAKLKHDTPSDTVLRHFAVRFRRPFVGMLVLFCLLTVSNPFATYSHLTDWHQHSLQGVTRFVQEEYPGGEITLIDCFWAYGLYPFGTAYSVSHHDFTGATGFDAGYFEHHVYETRLGVVCPGSQNAIRDSLLQRFSDFIVYNQEDFIVIAMRDGNSQERLRSDHSMIRLLCSNTC